ncbi:MAG: glycosyltransferase family 39 protein [Candidatus Chisholmbacteria bacterium]|nr:glycosyltransferase family 39 protein [Candidatus Chisholmbacteria bacterium]
MNPKLLLILLLALILRLISLNQSLWLDEGIQWWAVTTFPLKHLVTEYIKGDFNPPLYHAILYLWVKLFGDSEIVLRLPSVLFGLGTVYFVFKIGGLRAALLTATAPLLIYYSQEARMYSLAAFTATATLYFLIKKSKIYYLISAIFMLYSHYLTWLLLPILFLSAASLTGIVLVTLVPWLPVLWQQLNQGLGAAANPVWAQLGTLSLQNTLLVPVKFLIGRLPVEPNLFYALILFLPLSLSAYLLYKSFPRKLNAKRYSLIAILYAWLFIPLILGALISLKIPLFSYFRFLFVLPAFYLLLTLGIGRLPQKLRLYTFLFFLLINLTSSIYYLTSPQFHRENWRDAVAYIHSQPAPVVIYSAVRSPFEYYDRGQSLIISETNLDQLINQPETWYISYAQPIFDPDNKVHQTLNKLGFEAGETRHFRGITVTYYQNPKSRQYSMDY